MFLDGIFPFVFAFFSKGSKDDIIKLHKSRRRAA
jgi:hypothetical protein